MKVLIAYASSGIGRDAFSELGHDAWSCDILPCERGGKHFQCDIHDKSVWNTKWDLVIAHPPCTYLAASGMHWTTRGFRDKKLTEDALEEVKWLMSLPIPRLCIENPIGAINTRIRKPDQIIQPYQFGDDASKRTCLWLTGLSPLKQTNYVEPRMINGKPRWSNQTDSGQNKLAPSANRWKMRSATYQGIANAMATQWGQNEC